MGPASSTAHLGNDVVVAAHRLVQGRRNDAERLNTPIRVAMGVAAQASGAFAIVADLRRDPSRRLREVFVRAHPGTA